MHAPRMCLRCFPADGDIPHLVNGKRMPRSDSTKAEVFNKAGVSVRKMETTRWLAALITLIVLFSGIYLYNKSSKTIATLGLPLILVVAWWFSLLGKSDG